MSLILRFDNVAYNEYMFIIAAKNICHSYNFIRISSTCTLPAHSIPCQAYKRGNSNISLMKSICFSHNNQ